MFKVKKLSIESMGVVNITPNSFSDGGEAFCSSGLSKRLDDLSGFDIIDLGAESTAPFNEGISSKEELSRFTEVLYPQIDLLKSFKKISIDSYHLETVREVIKKIPCDEIIWNDVSGCFDNETKNFLKENPHISYVYSHTNAPERSKTNNHMEYCFPEVTLESTREYFENFLKESSSLENKFYLDPCFGFSKNREQNHAFLSFLPDLIKEVDHQNWLIGISRKSFLRFHKGEKSNVVKETEIIQSMLIQKWIDQLKDQKSTLAIRLHDPIIYNAWSNFYNSINDENE